MKIIAPDYYAEFSCIADQCRHTCCEGWEIEVDEESLERFRDKPDIMEHLSEEDASINLLPDEVCPFLDSGGLCRMILHYGEDILCQTCRDHPRFRNYWSDRIEIGLGLVCEEAGRIILGRETPMKLITFGEDDTEEEVLSEEESWLLEVREEMLLSVRDVQGPLARLKEYLIYRHIPDALYDDRLEERVKLIDWIYVQTVSAWERTDKSFASLVECARVLSYDVEYDEERKEKLLRSFENE